MKHLLAIKDLTQPQVERLLKKAQDYAVNPAKFYQHLNHIIVANLFFEDSTRTRFSFEVAEKKLGCHVLNFSAENSSMNKGETIPDTIKTLEQLGVKIAVIRHPDDHLLETLKNESSISFINAGAGKYEHPTQALLDLMTIKQEFGDLKNLTVSICGDIKYSRVARSNVHLLNMFGIKVNICEPEELRVKDATLDKLVTKKTIDEALPESDVIMLLRVQSERHDGQELNKAEYLKQYGLTAARLKKAKAKTIIMHPAPINRGVEIESDLVEHAKSRILKQMSNGVYMRMAIIDEIAGTM
ncbi:MAG: aspartate carbamoyltransferase catalytic subunit [Bacteriovoracaceae bacterium]|nr:aspartate carbamoyltransferase catalytic subunit [Bacteriovoracaceae bacterium]